MLVLRTYVVNDTQLGSADSSRPRDGRVTNGVPVRDQGMPRATPGLRLGKS
jgi:hypothetical protein